MCSTDLAETPQLNTIADGFYVRVAVDNIAWIDMGHDILVVDALEQPELADAVIAKITASVPHKRVGYVINTHSHYDHIALNKAFVDRFNAQIISQSTGGIPVDGRWIKGSKRRALILPMPGCHTNEDCVVWVPDARTLFVGDIFGWGLIPLMTNLRRDAVNLLIATYQRLIEFDAKIVIPGHGPLCTSAHLQRWVEYVEWVIERVSKAYSSGLQDSVILNSLPPPKDMNEWWRFTQWKHKDSVSKVLKAVRRGWL